MSETQRRPLGKRMLFRALRALLWPMARLRPKSAWARMYERLRRVQDDTFEDLARRPLQQLTRPRTLLALLLAAAAAFWIRDCFREPRPAPEHACVGAH